MKYLLARILVLAALATSLNGLAQTDSTGNKNSASIIRPLFAFTTEYTSGTPLFGIGAGVVFGQYGRFGIGANYEFESSEAREADISHNYIGAVAFYNVFRIKKTSMSFFVRGGNLQGNNWIIVPGIAANYHLNENFTGVLHAGLRPDDPTIGLAVFWTPFKRKAYESSLEYELEE